MTKNELFPLDRRALLGASLALAALPHGAFAATPAEAAASIAPGGTLRAAINYGNAVLAQKAPDGTLTGVSIQLATELARRLALPLTLVPFPAAGQVTAAQGTWDVAFLAIDPQRAQEIAFTAPYVVIDATYMVAKDSPYHSVADLDVQGANLIVEKGAAYDLYLSRTLKHATITRTATPVEAVQLFLSSHAAAVANVRKPLEDFARTHGDVRVLTDSITRVDQAMAMAKGREAGFDYLKAFVEEMKASGFVRRALDATGQDAMVAPPA